MDRVAWSRYQMETTPDYNGGKKRAAERRMAFVDSLPPHYRSLVNDYGTAAVMACFTVGVREPRHIRHIIDTIRGERPDGHPTINPNGGVKNGLRDDDDGAVYIATGSLTADERKRRAAALGRST